MVKKIIWVDDDVYLLRPQHQFLSEAGYEVEMVPDVDEAWEIIRENKDGSVNAIIDIMMNPGILFQNENHNYGLRTGVLFAKKLKDCNFSKRVRFFVFTHCSDNVIEREVKQLGVSFYSKQDYRGSKVVEIVNSEFESE